MAPMPPEQITALLDDRTKHWTSEQRRSLLNMLKAAKTRRDIVKAVDHPAALAKLCDHNYRITPAVELVSRSIERVLREPGRNLLVTAPPQELKSTLCSIWTPIRALQLNPAWNIMSLTYADHLAERNSRKARNLIERYGTGAVNTLTGAPVPDRLGISLLRGQNSVGNWGINEGDGGMVAAGLRATVTGLSADLIIVDDPYKGPQEADSPAIREKILDLFLTVADTRLAPGGRFILIQTRWHPDDLAGHIIKTEAELPPHLRTWRYINIPAISHPGVPDALKRPEPGIAMESARGRTLEEFEARRRRIGERFWFAMYMGVPTDPEGGLFSRSWFEDNALDAAPEQTLARVVTVDPAETGERDEAGIVAASITREGTIVLSRDASGQMTSDQWARKAVDLALETGASQIWIEAYTAGTTYVNVIKKAIAAKLRGLDQHPTGTAEECMRLYNVKSLLTAMTVHPWRGTGDAVARSSLLRQGVEVGTTRVVSGEMDEFVEQAVSWQASQHQPDRVAAAVIAHGVLSSMLSKRSGLGNPLSSVTNGRDTGWLARSVG